MAKSKRASKSRPSTPRAIHVEENIHVEKLQKGYLVRQYTGRGEKKVFAGSQNDVSKLVKKMLG